MNCPCCKSSKVIRVSVCQSCGNSIEDLATSEIHVAKKNVPQTNMRSTAVQKSSSRFKLNPPPSPILMDAEIESATKEIQSKQTNRTLLEFQSKDGTVPEWRVQLQNAVRQRALDGGEAVEPAAVAETPDSNFDSDDDFFDNAEIIEVNRPSSPSPASSSKNDLLINALSRIDASRERFHIATPKSQFTASATATATAPALQPDTIVEPLFDEVVREKTSINFPKVEPKVEFETNVDLYDTSELNPEFEPAQISSSFGKITSSPQIDEDKIEIKAEKTAAANQVSAEALTESESELQTVVYEEDNAPFAFRFNSGVFDLLTSCFASMLLMAPFVLLGGEWFSVSGLFGFLTIFTIVSFLYLTTTIGLFGKSFGMHLFSIELIHANGDEYPSLHQAAVSSSLYLLSIASLGSGFITCLFDDERRAVHDIISDTIVVREG